MTVQTEYARDRAKARLDVIERAEGACQTAVEEAVSILAKVVACSDKDRNYLVGCIWESLHEIVDAARIPLQSEINTLDEQIADADERDLHRSSPVVI